MEKMQNVISSIKERTGLDIDLYTAKGENILSTEDNEKAYNFAMHSHSDFVDGIIADSTQNITYFQIKTPKQPLVGVILGSNLVSQNYAFMVSKLLESAAKTERSGTGQADTIKQIILGELDELELEGLKKVHPELDTGYYVFYIVCDKLSTLKSFLEDLCEADDFLAEMGVDSLAYLKKCGQNNDYSSATEFAETLLESIDQEVGIKVKIGVGGISHSLKNLSSIYSQSIAAYRLGRLIDKSTRLYSFNEYILLRLIDDLPKSKLQKYVDSFISESTMEVLEDDELMITAEQFLSNSLNMSETARLIFTHRNTLIYRLDKIEAATGLNIRRFSDALTFRMLVVIYKLLKNK